MPLSAGSQQLVYAGEGGPFQNAHNFVVQNPIILNAAGGHFMEKFAELTLQGAELDSSERDPPPRCHPGTRKEIVDRMQLWCHNQHCRAKSVLWLVGPAGVGKSAIMQTVAELLSNSTTILTALFFSALNRRNDPKKVIATLAYQIALRHKPYYQYVYSKVTANPKLWHKSIIAQFSEFIFEPFIKAKVYRGNDPILIFIDGLDECEGEREQILLLSLICYFATRFPEAPLLWIIASRPEAHITAHLARRRLKSCFEKQEVSIDSTEACRDVERFLRAEFEKIKGSNPFMSLYPRWPPENVFLKLAAAAVGLFAYAATIIRFVDGPNAGDPISRLKLITDLIDNGPRLLPNLPSTSAQPMAQLDILYRYILSQVPSDDLPYTQENLLAIIFSHSGLKDTKNKLSFFCDWTGQALHVLSGVLRHLHAVVKVPFPSTSFLFGEQISFYHKSFSDFLLDPRRSGISLGTQQDEYHRDLSRAVRVLRDIPQYGSLEPGRRPHQYTILSSLYCGPFDIDFRRILFDHACDVIRTSFEYITSLPPRDVAHALEVAINTRPASLNEALLLSDDDSDLVQHLRRNGVVRDIPARSLGLDVINHTHCANLVQKLPDRYTLLNTSVGGGPNWAKTDEVLKCLRDAVLHQRSDEFVRAFIGREGKGWIASNPPMDPITYFFDYDFSTIYHRL